MMIAVKQYLDAIIMYIILRYHIYKIRTDSRYMFKEALNALKASADGSVDTHLDVDTSIASWNFDDQLSWNGTQWVPKPIRRSLRSKPIRTGPVK